MRHNNPRFRLRSRVRALRRRRTVVEFMAGFPAEPFYPFRKRLPLNNRRQRTEEDPSTQQGGTSPRQTDPA